VWCAVARTTLHLREGEKLNTLSTAGRDHLEDVVSHSLGQRAALADGHAVSLAHTQSRAVSMCIYIYIYIYVNMSIDAWVTKVLAKYRTHKRDTTHTPDVSRDVAVAFLVTAELVVVVEVVTADDDGALHLGAVHGALENAAADRDVGSERALLVNVGAWSE
jgi:hypothetical protein